MRIAIIPARGGSKRIPKKNIKEFFGKPMIAWSIGAAQESGLFDRIIVSTDDSEIADISNHFGAEVPFIRPLELSNDYAGTTDVIAHATQWIVDRSANVSAVCCIYATAPFLRANDIKRGLEALESGDWAYAFAVTDFAAPIFRSFKQSTAGGIEMLFPEYYMTHSRDIPNMLHDAGQFYWGTPSAWIGGKRIFDYHSTPVLIPRWRVQDIDTPEDWERAEMLAPTIMSRKNG